MCSSKDGCIKKAHHAKLVVFAFQGLGYPSECDGNGLIKKTMMKISAL